MKMLEDRVPFKYLEQMMSSRVTWESIKDTLTSQIEQKLMLERVEQRVEQLEIENGRMLFKSNSKTTTDNTSTN